MEGLLQRNGPREQGGLLQGVSTLLHGQILLDDDVVQNKVLADDWNQIFRGRVRRLRP